MQETVKELALVVGWEGAMSNVHRKYDDSMKAWCSSDKFKHKADSFLQKSSSYTAQSQDTKNKESALWLAKRRQVLAEHDLLRNARKVLYLECSLCDGEKDSPLQLLRKSHSPSQQPRHCRWQGHGLAENICIF